MSELVIAEGQSTWNEQQKAALVQMGLGEAPRGDIDVFFHQAQRAGLDPFSKQIYLIGRNTKVGNQWIKKYTIQTSIEGFRIIRDRQKARPYSGHTEQWCGKDGAWKDVWLDEEPPMAARVLVSIAGFAEPVPGIALWSEFAPMKDGKPTGQWSKMPALMLAKCAEALALRKAYPHDLSGLYTSDEMDQAAPAPAAAPEPVQTAVAAPARDWVAEAADAQSVDELRMLWGAAQAAGALNMPVDGGGVLGDLLRARKEALENPVEEVVDAEVVEDEPKAEPVTEWPVAPIPGSDEAATPVADDDEPF